MRDEEGCSGSTSHQTVVPAPPTPSVEAISSKAGEIATKIEDRGETEAVAEKTHSKTNEKFEEVKNSENIPEPDPKVREELEPATMRQTGVADSQELVKAATDQQVAGNNNNKVSLLKSDSGFAESVEESRNITKHSVPTQQQPSGESVKAIYKSDSGFSEHGGVPSFEEDDVATPVKVKHISVEQAHNMFEKRYSAMLGQDDMAMFGAKSDPVPPALKKVSNVIDEEDDSDEETDTDESDEDSVAEAKGSSICSGSGVFCLIVVSRNLYCNPKSLISFCYQLNIFLSLSLSLYALSTVKNVRFSKEGIHT